MSKNIEPKLIKIGDYLKLDKDTLFIIPEYQRAYSWGIENCDKLWQDITYYAENDNKDSYFFGTIIINCQDSDTKFSLIDGQQRTTTFLLLLKAMLIKINIAIEKTKNDEDSESLCRGLKERRRKIMRILYKAETEDISDTPNSKEDKKICENSEIIENYSINELYKNELSTILKALNYEDAKNTVKKIPYKQKDNKYTNYFKNFKYFYEKINELSESQLNKIARTICDNCEVIEIKSWKVEQAITMFNSLNSDGLPLFDSDIISAKLYAVAEKNGNAKNFTNLWKVLIDELNDVKINNIIDIDSIFMQLMYYERAKNKEIINESGSINVTTPGLRRYFTEINKNILNNPNEFCEKMINLVKIWKKVIKYPIAQVLLKFNENSKLFLASYFCKFNNGEIQEKDIKIIIENMLRLFAILELVDVGYSSKNFKSFLFKEEVKLIDETISLNEISDDFNNHIRNNWSNKEIEDLIKEYDKNALVFLNEYLVAIEKKYSFNLDGAYDIEHIMPYSGNNNQSIREDAGILSEDEFNVYVNKLGNKILLEQKINRAIGNEWFRTKVSTNLENKTGYVNSKYPVANELVKKYKNKNKAYWKKDDINESTDKISERITKFIFKN